MAVTTVRTYSEVAGLLGTDYRTISGLVRAKGINPKPTGLPGRGSRTGLDEQDIAVLRKSLAPVGDSPK